MGNLICCQTNTEDTQIKIEKIIQEDKLYYASKNQRHLFRIKSQYDIRRLKYLQANIKARQFRSKLKRELKLNKTILKSELKANTVGNNLSEIISKHFGYTLLKKSE